jgi:hypothetical protein
MLDITPISESRGGVASFDVMKTIDNRVIICTAFSDLSEEMAVYHCTIADFSCSWNADTKDLVGLDPKRKISFTLCIVPPTEQSRRTAMDAHR